MSAAIDVEELSIESLRGEFPITRDAIYLNNAATSPIPRRTRDAMVAAIDERLHAGNLKLPQWRERYAQVRESIAQLINVQAHEIAFTKNTSDGICLAANGLRWVPGDNLVLPARDFPSNYYPWVNLERRGLELRYIPDRDGRIQVDDARPLIDKRTRAMSVSSVRYDSGYRLDLAAFGGLCADNKVLFFVDAIQQLGALTLDAERCGISALACGSHKWMMGPRGVAFLYVSSAALDELDVDTLGWMSVVDAYGMQYKLDLLPDARRFEGGTENTAGIHGLGASVDLHHAFGLQRAETRVLELNAYLREGLLRRGYEILSPDGEHERSGIMIAKSPTHSAETVVEELRKANVFVVGRGAGVRISPHYYNTHAEIDTLLEALPAKP